MSAAPARILVVDDDPAARGTCRRILERMGLRVEAACDSREAAPLWQDGLFDLVLTDVHMTSPGEGVSLAEEVRSHSPSTDVILMTGDPSLDSAIPAMRHGARDYLIKPFQPAQLELVVNNCLERRRLSAELAAERGLRAELDAAYGELKKVERLKDAFLARINHELRTPVAVALMASEIVEAKLVDEEGRKIWRRLNDAVKSLKEVVEQLVLYSSLVQHPSLRRQSVDVRALLEELVQRHRALSERRDVSVALSVDGEARPVPGDPALLETAFRHLLLNAIRFNRKGGKVSIELRFRPREVQVALADTGIGIPDSELGRIFDGFYQVAEHLTRSVGGLGLGLATVRRIAESHGGSVTVASAVGGGSTFTVTLPAA